MMARLFPRFRFDRGFAFGAAIAVLAIGLMIGLINESLYSRQKLQELRIQASTLAEAVAAPLMFSDAIAARENANALAANPQVDAVGIYGADRRALAGFRREGAAPLPESGAPSAAAHRGAFSEITQTVQRDGERYGAVYLRLRRDTLLTRIGRYAPIGLLVLMTALVLAVTGAAQGALSGAYRELEARADDLAAAKSKLEAEIEQRKTAEEALLQSRKMEAIGQLTGGVAHDFNNLLMVISGGLRMLERRDDPERRRKTMDAMHQAVERGAGLTRQLLAFARRQPVELQAIEVDQQISGMRELLERSLRADILLDISVPATLAPVMADPNQFELAILNLCVNARDAMPKGGVITVSALQRGERVEVWVADTGAGIAPEILDRIFEPYFTTKPVGQGTGLGLAQVYGFAQQMGGAVRVQSKVGEGTTVIISLPITQRVAAPAAPEASALQHDDAARRVLVVKDDDQVADMVCAMFEELGHQPERARSAHEALEALRAERRYDLVFSDIIMPGGKSGIELARDLAELAPKLPVLLTTGYSGGVDLDPGRPVLRKPYQIGELRSALAALPIAAH